MAIEECRVCRYSKTYDEALACRRYPPSIFVGGRAVYPIVFQTEWCGEFLAMKPGAGLPTALKPPKPDPRPGRAAGGHARAAALSEARRSEIASNAAAARWRRP